MVVNKSFTIEQECTYPTVTLRLLFLILIGNYMNLKTYREMKCLFFFKMLEIITKIVRKTRNNREEQENRFCT